MYFRASEENKEKKEHRRQSPQFEGEKQWKTGIAAFMELVVSFREQKELKSDDNVSFFLYIL